MSAASTIHTDAHGLATGWAEIPVGADTLPAYYAAPAARPSVATILVVQEIFGVHDHIQDVCRRLGKCGYLAIAPELYFRQGDPAGFTEISRLVADLVARVPDAQVMADLDACAAWAAARGGDPDRLGITGFCWGGRIVWLYAAHRARLRAGVAWYGRLRGVPGPFTPQHPLDVAARIQVPVLGLYGARDEGIPAADAEAMAGALRSAGRPGEILVYPDAGHAFHADYRPSYRQAEAEDGWRRMQDWFQRHGL